MRRIAIENLRNVSQAGSTQMVLPWCQPLFGLRVRCRASAFYLHICSYERPHKPRPYRSLVICAITTGAITGVKAVILRITWGEAAEPVGREQMFLHDSNHPLCSLRTQHGIWQADREDLIRTNTPVGQAVVHYVIQVATCFIPEQAIEAGACENCHCVVSLTASFVADTGGKVFHNANCVVPERLNFHRLPMSRRDDPVADPCVHPGQLHARLAEIEQAGCVQLYSIAGAANMPVDDVSENWVKLLLNECRIAGICVVGANSFEEPQGRI